MTRRGVAAVFGAALAVGSLSPSPALAVRPDEVLTDPAAEARARRLSAEIRCVVCQNQSIDDSDADLARDLRLVVREQVRSGASDEDIRGFLVARYGEFVLLRPPFRAGTVLLWIAPFAVLGAGAWAAFALSRRRAAAQPALTDADEARIAALLDAEDARTRR